MKCRSGDPEASSRSGAYYTWRVRKLTVYLVHIGQQTDADGELPAQQQGVPASWSQAGQFAATG